MKVLVIRFSSIGDIVLTTPVLRGLHQQLGAEVQVLTKEPFLPVLQSNPNVSKVWTIRQSVWECAAALRAEGFDAIVDLHHNMRSFQVRALLPGVRYHAFPKLNLEKWLMVRFKWDWLPRIHIVARYMQAVRALGVKEDGQGLDYFIPPEEEVRLASLAADSTLDVRSKEQLVQGDYVALVVGAAHGTKRIPRIKVEEFCRTSARPVLLLGGAAERAEGEQVAAAFASRVINTCGQYRLHQSASLVRQSRVVVTSDTGLMHIAAAFQKPIISVWGNTIPEFGMTPYYPIGMQRNTSVEVKGLDCRPCSKIGYKTCPKGHFRCMLELEIPSPDTLLPKNGATKP